MCMVDYGDAPEFWFERHVKRARLAHECAECHRPIAVGEEYWRGFGKQDGYTYNCATCRHCRVISDWLWRNCDGFVYGAMVEDFGNHAEGSIDMLRLVIGARRRWQRFDRTGLMSVPRDPRDMVHSGER